MRGRRKVLHLCKIPTRPPHKCPSTTLRHKRGRPKTSHSCKLPTRYPRRRPRTTLHHKQHRTNKQTHKSPSTVEHGPRDMKQHTHGCQDSRTRVCTHQNGPPQGNGSTSINPLDSDNDSCLIHNDSVPISISCEAFNCKGFKQSSDYILERFVSSDFLCLSETWLKPSELVLIEDSLGEKFGKDSFTVFSKSAMEDIDPEYRGRPFGGVAMLCKNRSGLFF